MTQIGIVVGNGLTIDFCRHSRVSLDPSNPFAWDFKVPDDNGVHWSRAFPTLHAVIATNAAHSFSRFEELLRRTKDENPSALLDAEARQFLVFAYSVLQEECDRYGVSGWRWTDWLLRHRDSLCLGASFNYDLLLENALQEVGISPHRFGVEGESPQGLVLKPHGSIDFTTDPRSISLPPQVYPMRIVSTLNHTALVSIGRQALRTPRQEAIIVLPAEYSPYLRHQFVQPSYARWCRQAESLTHCVFVGLSDWECDRHEIDTMLAALSPHAIVVVANPNPARSFLERVTASGRACHLWPDGPKRLP